MTSIAAVVLAGGQSQRFGSPKASALYQGRPLICHVIERLSPQVSHLAIAGSRMQMDAIYLDDGVHAGAGPVAGILAGLAWASSIKANHLLSAPCDVPLIPRNLVQTLLGRTLVKSERSAPIALKVNGRVENACALWPLSCAAKIDRLVTKDHMRAVHDLLRILKATHLDVAEADLDGSFFNVNTRAELHTLESARTSHHD